MFNRSSCSIRVAIWIFFFIFFSCHEFLEDNMWFAVFCDNGHNSVDRSVELFPISDLN